MISLSSDQAISHPVHAFFTFWYPGFAQHVLPHRVNSRRANPLSAADTLMFSTTDIGYSTLQKRRKKTHPPGIEPVFFFLDAEMPVPNPTASQSKGQTNVQFDSILFAADRPGGLFGTLETF